ncbi:hypothetical protein GS397_10270 [Sphingobium yanoikuyae]|jgi:hypothetical protein|uniref:Lipoprotein n=1 Tax=Sphingobium yanoikuyae TaxID=13690 RepID=A0A6M4G6S5_SPHYA|nr:hypothetical protein [Sphingobium yanoikuyae]QHD67397.1 hypothetical protein GS397_10270 [Sphingobium yanoikuyae]QJR01963.1 hypothetical protein HH800_06960 [Sphingobium yanoikuyae]
METLRKIAGVVGAHKKKLAAAASVLLLAVGCAVDPGVVEAALTIFSVMGLLL